MKKLLIWLSSVSLLALCALAQGDPEAQHPDRSRPEPKMSVEGREALARCRDLARQSKGLRGAERMRALAEAASNYDRVAGGFASEAAVSAKAAFEAAELWRRQGSEPLAEKSYLLAASTDPGRYGARGLLGAADMQRRQMRPADALASYRKVVADSPTAPQAQDARLAIAKLLATMERFDEAVAAAQVALECARPGSQTVEVCNELALIHIQRADLDAAGRALEHAAQSIEGADNDDPIVQERLQKAVESMSARQALQRARDQQNGTADDAVQLDRDRQRGVAPGPKKL